MNDGYFRTKEGYTIVQNPIVRDSNLSLKAKGLYLVIQANITMPNKKWTKDDFRTYAIEGKKAFDSAWQELLENGYLKVHMYSKSKNWIIEYELLEEAKPGPYTFYYNSDGKITSTNETRASKTERRQEVNPAEKQEENQHYTQNGDNVKKEENQHYIQNGGNVKKEENQHYTQNGGNVRKDENQHYTPNGDNVRKEGENQHYPHYGYNVDGYNDNGGNKIINTIDIITDMDNNPINHIYHSIPQDTPDRKEEVEEMIKENVDYEILLERYPSRKVLIDQIIELMVWSIAYGKDLKISGVTYPHTAVASCFEKYHFEMFEYVLETLSNNTTQVKNVKQYILASLINAPKTYAAYYGLQVQHDMYYKK